MSSYGGRRKPISGLGELIVGKGSPKGSGDNKRNDYKDILKFVAQFFHDFGYDTRMKGRTEAIVTSIPDRFSFSEYASKYPNKDAQVKDVNRMIKLINSTFSTGSDKAVPENGTDEEKLKNVAEFMDNLLKQLPNDADSIKEYLVSIQARIDVTIDLIEELIKTLNKADEDHDLIKTVFNRLLSVLREYSSQLLYAVNLLADLHNISPPDRAEARKDVVERIRMSHGMSSKEYGTSVSDVLSMVSDVAEISAALHFLMNDIGTNAKALVGSDAKAKDIIRELNNAVNKGNIKFTDPTNANYILSVLSDAVSDKNDDDIMANLKDVKMEVEGGRPYFEQVKFNQQTGKIVMAEKSPVVIAVERDRSVRNNIYANFLLIINNFKKKFTQVIKDMTANINTNRGVRLGSRTNNAIVYLDKVVSLLNSTDTDDEKDSINGLVTILQSVFNGKSNDFNVTNFIGMVNAVIKNCMNGNNVAQGFESLVDILKELISICTTYIKQNESIIKNKIVTYRDIVESFGGPKQEYVPYLLSINTLDVSIDYAYNIFKLAIESHEHLDNIMYSNSRFEMDHEKYKELIGMAAVTKINELNSIKARIDVSSLKNMPKIGAYVNQYYKNYAFIYELLQHIELILKGINSGITANPSIALKIFDEIRQSNFIVKWNDNLVENLNKLTRDAIRSDVEFEDAFKKIVKVTSEFSGFKHILNMLRIIVNDNTESLDMLKYFDNKYNELLNYISLVPSVDKKTIGFNKPYSRTGDDDDIDPPSDDGDENDNIQDAIDNYKEKLSGIENEIKRLNNKLKIFPNRGDDIKKQIKKLNMKQNKINSKIDDLSLKIPSSYKDRKEMGYYKKEKTNDYQILVDSIKQILITKAIDNRDILKKLCKKFDNISLSEDISQCLENAKKIIKLCDNIISKFDSILSSNTTEDNKVDALIDLLEEYKNPDVLIEDQPAIINCLKEHETRIKIIEDAKEEERRRRAQENRNLNEAEYARLIKKSNEAEIDNLIDEINNVYDSIKFEDDTIKNIEKFNLFIVEGGIIPGSEVDFFAPYEAYKKTKNLVSTARNTTNYSETIANLKLNLASLIELKKISNMDMYKHMNTLLLKQVENVKNSTSYKLAFNLYDSLIKFDVNDIFKCLYYDDFVLASKYQNCCSARVCADILTAITILGSVEIKIDKDDFKKSTINLRDINGLYTLGDVKLYTTKYPKGVHDEDEFLNGPYNDYPWFMNSPKYIKTDDDTVDVDYTYDSYSVYYPAIYKNPFDSKNPALRAFDYIKKSVKCLTIHEVNDTNLYKIANYLDAIFDSLQPDSQFIEPDEGEGTIKLNKELDKMLDDIKENVSQLAEYLKDEATKINKCLTDNNVQYDGKFKEYFDIIKDYIDNQETLYNSIKYDQTYYNNETTRELLMLDLKATDITREKYTEGALQDGLLDIPPREGDDLDITITYNHNTISGIRSSIRNSPYALRLPYYNADDKDDIYTRVRNYKNDYVKANGLFNNMFSSYCASRFEMFNGIVVDKNGLYDLFINKYNVDKELLKFKDDKRFSDMFGNIDTKMIEYRDYMHFPYANTGNGRRPRFVKGGAPVTEIIKIVGLMPSVGKNTFTLINDIWCSLFGAIIATHEFNAKQNSTALSVLKNKQKEFLVIHGGSRTLDDNGNEIYQSQVNVNVDLIELYYNMLNLTMYYIKNLTSNSRNNKNITITNFRIEEKFSEFITLMQSGTFINKTQISDLSVSDLEIFVNLVNNVYEKYVNSNEDLETIFNHIIIDYRDSVSRHIVIMTDEEAALLSDPRGYDKPDVINVNQLYGGEYDIVRKPLAPSNKFLAPTQLEYEIKNKYSIYMYKDLLTKFINTIVGDTTNGHKQINLRSAFQECSQKISNTRYEDKLSVLSEFLIKGIISVNDTLQTQMFVYEFITWPCKILQDLGNYLSDFINLPTDFTHVSNQYRSLFITGAEEVISYSRSGKTNNFNFNKAEQLFKSMYSTINNLYLECTSYLSDEIRKKCDSNIRKVEKLYTALFTSHTEYNKSPTDYSLSYIAREISTKFNAPPVMNVNLTSTNTVNVLNRVPTETKDGKTNWTNGIEIKTSANSNIVEYFNTTVVTYLLDLYNSSENKVISEFVSNFYGAISSNKKFLSPGTNAITEPSNYVTVTIYNMLNYIKNLKNNGKTEIVTDDITSGISVTSKSNLQTVMAYYRYLFTCISRAADNLDQLYSNENTQVFYTIKNYCGILLGGINTVSELLLESSTRKVFNTEDNYLSNVIFTPLSITSLLGTDNLTIDNSRQYYSLCRFMFYGGNNGVEPKWFRLDKSEFKFNNSLLKPGADSVIDSNYYNNLVIMSRHNYYAIKSIRKITGDSNMYIAYTRNSILENAINKYLNAIMDKDDNPNNHNNPNNTHTGLSCIVCPLNPKYLMQYVPFYNIIAYSYLYTQLVNSIKNINNNNINANIAGNGAGGDDDGDNNVDSGPDEDYYEDSAEIKTLKYMLLYDHTIKYIKSKRSVSELKHNTDKLIKNTTLNLNKHKEFIIHNVLSRIDNETKSLSKKSDYFIIYNNKDVFTSLSTKPEYSKVDNPINKIFDGIVSKYANYVGLYKKVDKDFIDFVHNSTIEYLDHICEELNMDKLMGFISVYISDYISTIVRDIILKVIGSNVNNDVDSIHSTVHELYKSNKLFNQDNYEKVIPYYRDIVDEIKRILKNVNSNMESAWRVVAILNTFNISKLTKYYPEVIKTVLLYYNNNPDEYINYCKYIDVTNYCMPTQCLPQLSILSNYLKYVSLFYSDEEIKLYIKQNLIAKDESRTDYVNDTIDTAYIHIREGYDINELKISHGNYIDNAYDTDFFEFPKDVIESIQSFTTNSYEAYVNKITEDVPKTSILHRHNECYLICALSMKNPLSNYKDYNKYRNFESSVDYKDDVEFLYTSLNTIKSAYSNFSSSVHKLPDSVWGHKFLIALVLVNDINNLSESVRTEKKYKYLYAAAVNFMKTGFISAGNLELDAENAEDGDGDDGDKKIIENSPSRGYEIVFGKSLDFKNDELDLVAHIVKTAIVHQILEGLSIEKSIKKNIIAKRNEVLIKNPVIFE